MSDQKNSAYKPDKVVYDLNSTKDGETSEKSHGASYQNKLSFQCHL